MADLRTRFIEDYAGGLLNIARQELSSTGEVLAQDGFVEGTSLFVEDGRGVKSGLRLGSSLAECIDPTTETGILNVRSADRTYAKIRDLKIFATAVASAQGALSESVAESFTNLEGAFESLESDVQSYRTQLSETVTSVELETSNLSERVRVTESNIATINSSLSTLSDQVFSVETSGITDGERGDITVSVKGTVWDINPNTIGPAELIDTNVSAGEYINPTITVDDQGRITAAANNTIVGVTDGDKGDISVTSSGSSWTIDDKAVTYQKIQDITAENIILGRYDTGSGSIQEITIGSGLSITAGTLSASTTLEFTQSGSGAVQRTVESKLQDVVSVTDFGAVGDGSTDNTAAIQAAITYCSDGKRLYFPGGIFKITSTLTVAVGADIVIEGSGREDTIIRLVADNTTALVVGNAGGVTYSFTMRDIQFRYNGTASGDSTSVGVHLICNTHAKLDTCAIYGFYDNLKLEANGRCVFNSVFINTGGRSDKAGYGIHILNADAGVINSTGLHFTDIEIFSTSFPGSGYKACVYNEDVDGAYFNNCHFINGDRIYHAYASTGSVLGSIRFSNCYFDAYYLRAVEIGGDDAATSYKLNDHQFSTCYFRGGQAGSDYGVYHSTQLTTRLLQFSNCVFATANDVGIKSVAASNNLRSLIVTGCLFRDCNKDSVASANFIQAEAKQVVITGNIFDGADTNYTSGSGATHGYGVYIYGSGNVYNVSNNCTTVPAAAATATGEADAYLFVAVGGGASGTNSGDITANNTWVEL